MRTLALSLTAMALLSMETLGCGSGSTSDSSGGLGNDANVQPGNDANVQQGNDANVQGRDANVPSNDCTNKACGSDGCNGTCGACPPSQLCGPSYACETPSSTGAIVVDATSQLTVISPDIYGVALNSDDSVSLAGVNRWGGDSTGSYNWKNDIFNTGTDWNCANYKGLFTSPSPSSALTSSSDQFVHYNVSKNVDSLMTIPITGWLANQQTSGACAGGTYDASCCTQIGASESILVDKGSATLDTSYMKDWVSHLVSTFGNAAGGGVKYYQLDNEPDNWQALRKDIYPSLYPPGSFCEPFYTTISQVGTSINQDFINRTLAYSAAVKSADPTAYVLFMTMESPLDLVSLNDLECGNTGSPYSLSSSLTSAILTLGAQHETSQHQRVLDCVDMHYPVSGTGLNATQALWDKTSSSVFPHIQGWINTTYPGTGICVSEYNWPNDGTDGKAPDATTGLLEADLLGMYGRLGIRLAAYWTTLECTPPNCSKATRLPVYNGMAMYRDYDGAGGHFGAYSIGAASPTAGVHAYAATDSPTSPTKLWVMLVNASGVDQSNLSIALEHFTPGATAKVYRMKGGAAPSADVDAAVGNGTISGVSLPNGSVALYVVSAP
jgi:hypothetical protein